MCDLSPSSLMQEATVCSMVREDDGSIRNTAYRLDPSTFDLRIQLF